MPSVASHVENLFSFFSSRIAFSLIGIQTFRFTEKHGPYIDAAKVIVNTTKSIARFKLCPPF